MSMKVDVVTYDGARVSGLEVEEITLPGSDGQIGVLPMHIQMVSALGIGPMKLVTKDGRELYFALAGGFIEVMSDNIRILTEACEPAADIDRERAEKKLTEALAKLEKLTPNQAEEYKAVSNSVKKARTRLSIAGK